jgi:hypothetical protein
MKEIGYYYSSSIKTLILGYKDKRGSLHGKVIGDTFKSKSFRPFEYGYKYNSWYEGFIYVGKLIDYTTINGYLNFLNNSSNKQIEKYLLVKHLVLKQHNSYIIKRDIMGKTFKYSKQK